MRHSTTVFLLSLIFSSTAIAQVPDAFVVSDRSSTAVDALPGETESIVVISLEEASSELCRALSPTSYDFSEVETLRGRSVGPFSIIDHQSDPLAGSAAGIESLLASGEVSGTRECFTLLEPLDEPLLFLAGFEFSETPDGPAPDLSWLMRVEDRAHAIHVASLIPEATPTSAAIESHVAYWIIDLATTAVWDPAVPAAHGEVRGGTMTVSATSTTLRIDGGFYPHAIMHSVTVGGAYPIYSNETEGHLVAQFAELPPEGAVVYVDGAPTSLVITYPQGVLPPTASEANNNSGLR